MLHIKPIQQKDAAPTVAAVYKDIQSVFDIDTIPLVFQYIANYERYFVFLWERMRANIQATSFKNSCKDIQMFTTQAVEVIFTPSVSLKEFINSIQPLEKQHIWESIVLLEHINTTLLLLLIDLRESMKSIFIGTQRLAQYESEMHGENFTEFMQKEMGLTLEKSQNNELSEASRMLTPLFGTNALIVSRYPDFFAHVGIEMEKLKNTEVYLNSRVALEHLSLRSIANFVQPLGISYQEFIKLTQERPHINELLYLLTDAFPSQFPHLVFTSALMKLLLRISNSPTVVLQK